MLQVNKLEWVWRFHQIWIASCGFTPCRRWLGSQPTVSWRLWEGLQTNASDSSPDWCANFGLTKFWGPKTSATLFRLLHISAPFPRESFFWGFEFEGITKCSRKILEKGGSRFRIGNPLNEIPHLELMSLNPCLVLFSHSEPQYSSKGIHYMCPQEQTEQHLHKVPWSPFKSPRFSTRFSSWKAIAKFMICKYRSPLLPPNNCQLAIVSSWISPPISFQCFPSILLFM